MSVSRESAAGLRHRLRTPLNHIIGYSEMLLEEGERERGDEFAEQLRRIREIGRCVVVSVQNALSPSGRDATDRDIERFRSEVRPVLEDLVRTAGGALEIAPEKSVADVLRIASAGRELLDFAMGGMELDREARVRPEVATKTVKSGKASVLAVDDDGANRDILSRQLQRLGFSAVVAGSGEEALERLEEESFDIALVDFMMPGMDGLDLLKAMKANAGTRDVPVVMLSAFDELSGVSRCIESGADDYLFKPFEPVLLSARISAALERTRLRERERERRNELERISDELQRSNEDLKRFAYAASHDLQAPLRTITTHLQLLERRLGGRLEQGDLDLIRFPVDAALRMSQLIKDLLTYSQVSTEERVLSPVATGEVLAATMNDLKAAIAETHAEITNGPLPTLVADPVHLRQLFLNLVGNAVKYHGDAPPKVHVEARREPELWHFLVKDNGVGIPPEHIEDVFKMFRRLHGHERPGTGLGLTICRRIMERVGGRIWVESEVNAGSTFHFTIPDEQAPAVADNR